MGHSFAHTIPKPGPYMSHTISFRKGGANKYDDQVTFGMTVLGKSEELKKSFPGQS